MKKTSLIGQVMLLGAALTLLCGLQVAHAATYTVNTTCDDSQGNTCGTGPLTLRDAVNTAIAEVAAGGPMTETINFNIPATDPGCTAGVCTIALFSVLPATATGLTLTIDASTSAQSIIISGGSQSQFPNPTPGLITNNGPLTLNALTIANFSCNENDQGCNFSAIQGYYAPLTVTNSTFVNNSFVSAEGAAILQNNSTLTITNSTFVNNSAGVAGGAIYCAGCTLTVTNVTFSGNTSGTASAGGAIYNGGTATLNNTILAGGGTNGNCNIAGDEIGNQIIDGGGNLSDDSSCGFSRETSSNGVADTGSGEFEGLNLGALGSNGGPTQTVALLSGSVASTYGVVGNCPATDQRGVSRPLNDGGGTCSSGAYQYGTVQNGTGTAAGCTFPSTCNITGGDTQTIGAGTAAAAAALAALTGSAATITENICTVTMDPRQICPPGIPSSPYYNSPTLPVAAVCPSLPSGGAGTSVIPDYLCGDYGPSGAGSGTGFAVIQGIAEGVNAIPGLLNQNDADPDAFFGSTPTAAECSPTGVFVDNISFAWGPWSLSAVEGTIPEGNRLIELSDGCGGQKENGPGMSLMLIGATLNIANANQELGRLPKTLANFAEFKYVNLGVEVAFDPIDAPQKVRLLEIIAQGALFLEAGKNGCAEDTLYEADRYVINNATHFGGVPGRDPNSYGRTRSRVLNIFYTLFTRLDGNVNPINGSPLYINLPLLAPSLTGPPASCSSPYLGRDGY
jgi:predicted outer membrane repeat protein